MRAGGRLAFCSKPVVIIQMVLEVERRMKFNVEGYHLRDT